MMQSSTGNYNFIKHKKYSQLQILSLNFEYINVKTKNVNIKEILMYFQFIEAFKMETTHIY